MNHSVPDSFPSRARSLRKSIIAWFGANARPLPWRENRDAYQIWISEVMLQQTQVATVIPYFHRFLAAYPTLADLANANEHDVLRLWEGLGYYRRARDLLKAARILHEAGFDTVPNDVERVSSLPGFGRYTTNAVLSQAYDARLPILEANSIRLLCRLFGIETDPKSTTTQKQLWQLAESLLPQKNIGHFNQALMELGALVCKPAPVCVQCPLKRHCQANQQGRTSEIPLRAKSKQITAITEVAVVIVRGDCVLLVRRPPVGRWANLWEFPHEPHADASDRRATVARLLNEMGITATIDAEIATICHSVTRFRITLTALCVAYQSGSFLTTQYPEHAWVRVDELAGFPLSAPQRRLAKALVSSNLPFFRVAMSR